MLNTWTTAACKLKVGLIEIKVGEHVTHFKRRWNRKPRKQSKRKHKLGVKRNANGLNTSAKNQRLSNKFKP